MGRTEERAGRLSPGHRRPARSLLKPRRAPSRTLGIACALVAALALLVGAGAAEAQTSVKLVSNTGQRGSGGGSFSSHHQAFTTGSLSSKLTSVELLVSGAAAGPSSYSVSIHSDSSGSPGSSLGTLTNPTSLPSSHRLVQFTAPGGGIDLTANTTYFVKTAGPSGSAPPHFLATSSDAEDAGGVAGWSIADSSSFRNSRSFRMAIHGYATAADAGDDVTVRTGARVALDGAGSETGVSVLTYAWTQTGGPAVALDDATSATPAFIAPSVSSQTDLTFSLTVREGTYVREADTVTVTVLPSRIASASVNGSALTVTFDMALGTSRPAGSAFTVGATKTGSSRNIAGTSALVSISGRVVTATLSAAVAADERLTVRYDKPASGNVLKDTSGNALASVPARHAINAADTTRPRLSSAAANGAAFTAVFDEALDESVTPALGAFVVRVAGTRRLFAAGTGNVAGSTVTATLRSAVTHGQAVTVTYEAVPGFPEVQDLSGNKAVSGNVSVTNNTPPAFSSAAVNGSALTVTLDGGLDTASVPAGSAFTVKATRSGTERTVNLADTTPVAVSGSTVTLTLAEAVLRIDTVTVAYTAPATGKLQDADNLKHPVPNFSAQTATNNTAADTTRPRLSSAAASGAAFTAVFDEALDESVTPVLGAFVVRVAGTRRLFAAGTGNVAGSTVTATLRSAVTHGQAVTVTYEALPGLPEVQDLSGNKAVSGNASVTNNTPPAFSSAAVNGSALTVTLDGGLDTASVPAGSAFTVKATRSGTERTVNLADTTPVAVSGSTVTLTLAEAVLRIDTVTVAYTAPATGKLQDADNLKHPVPNFSAQTATNNTAADTTRPRLSSAAANGAAFTAVFDEALDESVTPALGAFVVRVAGTRRLFAAGTGNVAGSTVTATLRSAVTHGQAVTVTYEAVPGFPEVQDLSGNKAVSGNASVTNNTPPAFSSAAVNGSALTVTLDGGLDTASVPAGSAFTVKATRSGTERTVNLADTTPVAVSGSTVTLTLAEAVLRIDTVTVAYTAPATGKLQDADNLKHPVPNFSAQTATNNTAADTTRPRLSSAAANGAAFTAVFDEALDESVTPALGAFVVRVAGTRRLFAAGTGNVAGSTVTATLRSAVTHGQAVTVTYEAVPGFPEVQDLSGNKAVSGNASVTNNTPPAFSSAAVNGSALTVTLDGGLDTASVPAGSAFTVKATRSGTERTVNLADTTPVAVSGSTVTLTLAEAVLRIDTVTVAYTAPATGKLQDADNLKHPVPNFSAQTATNNTAADTTRPRLSSAAANGAAFTAVFDEALDESVTPALGAFVVRVAGTRRLFAAGTGNVAGSTVTATLRSAVTHGQAVTVTYEAVPGFPEVQDLSGNKAVSGNASVTNNTPPAFSSAAVNGSALTVTLDGGLDTASVPAGSAFTVKATRSGTERTVNLADTTPVAVSGSTVTLTLAEAVLRIDTVTVAYTAPATGKLQDADNLKHPVPNFSAQTATNNTAADTTRPRLSSAGASGAAFTAVFDEALDESVTPVLGAFVVRVAGTRRLFAAGTGNVAGSTVTATLRSAVTHGQAVTVTYEALPGLPEVQDLSGNKAVSGNASVTNNTPPAFSSAAVNGSALTVTFDGGLDTESVPAASAFTVKATRGGTERTVALAATGAVSVDGATVTLALAEALVRVETVTVAYTAPATGNQLQDADNAKLPVTGFGGTKTATNNTPADTASPTLVTAAMNGATLTLTYDEALDGSVSVPNNAYQRTVDGGAAEKSTAVAISERTVKATFATAVAHGQAVRVSYILPTTAANRIKDAAGNEAPAFSNEDATNDTPPPETRIASVAIASTPTVDADGNGTPETYGRDERIRVTVTWSADVLWDTSAAGAALSVGLDVGGTAKTAALVTGGATEGRARTLTFLYTVKQADRDSDGIGLTSTAAGDLVALAGGATLKDAHDRNASREHGALSGGAGHKVDGSRTSGPDTTAPELASAAIDADDGRRLTLTFDESLKTPTAQQLRKLRQAFFIEGSRFQGAPVTQSPSEVAVGGAAVTLRLGTEIPPGQTATVTYMAAAGGSALQDVHGNPVAGIEDHAVTRPDGGRGVPPVATAAQIAANKLTLTFDRALDAGSAPAGRRFEVHHYPVIGQNGPVSVARGTGVAAVSGATVAVTLDSAVRQGRHARVYYRRGDDPNPLRGAGGGPEAEDIISFFDTPVVDRTAPGLKRAVVAGTRLVLYYDEALDAGSTPATGDITVSVRTGTNTPTTPGVTGISVGGSTVTGTIGGTVAAGSTVAVTYTAGAQPIRDVVGNRAANLAGKAAENLGPSSSAKPALAATDPAVVSGTTVTLTFDQPLDPASVPAKSAFALTPTDGLRHVDSVAVRGYEVELGLAYPLYPCYADPVIGYTKPASNPLRNVWRTQAADSFSGRSARNLLRDSCRRATLQRVVARPDATSLQFERELNRDTPPRPDDFAVRGDGGGPGGGANAQSGANGLSGATAGPRSLAVDDARLSADARTVVLTLSPKPVAGERLTVRYTVPTADPGLWDADGNQVASFSVETVAEAADGPPAATGVAVVSDAGGDDTYGLGDTIRVAVTFDAAVVVDTAGGTPALTIDMDPAGWGEKQAAYASGSGTTTLVFTHEVVEPNVSTQGIAVLENTLALNGGTIRSAEGVDAALAHGGLAHDPKHKVDWRRAPAAPSAPAFDDGDDAALSIDENHADGAVVGTVAATDADGDAPTYSLSGDDAASFAIGADGAISVKSGTTLDHEAKASYAFTAAVTDGEDADGEAEETATTDDTIAVTVAVNNVEEPPGAPTGLTLSATSATALSASWTAPADTGALAIAGYELRWYAGTADPADAAGWTETGDVGTGTSAAIADLAADTAYRVQVRARGDGAGPWSASADGRTAALAKPAVTGVALTSIPADGDTYALGETIEVAVTFGEAVDVGGTPRLTIDMDPADWGAKDASFASGGGTATLTFSHAVVEPNLSTRGVAVLANTLALGGGTIRSRATGADADLAHAGLAHDPKHKVDWQYVAGPPPSAPAFDDGDNASFSVAENHADGAAVGTVAATDDDGDTLTYSLSGDDAASFAIGAGGAITVKSGTTLDHEAKASYAFTAEVTDGEDVDGAAEDSATTDDTIAVTVTVTNVEEPPGAPTGVAATAASATELSVTWTAPSDSGAVAVAGYVLRWVAGEADPADDSKWTETGDTGAGTSATIADLTADTVYRVQVRARGDGAGPWSGSGAGRTAAGDSTPPAPESATIDGRAVTLTFDEDLAAVDAGAKLHQYLTVTGGGLEQHPARATASGRTVTMELGSGNPARAGQAYTIGYFGNGPLEDAAGNKVARFSGQAAENLTLPALSAADARVEEGAGATLDFRVTLDAAASGAVTVDYATADGTARAGEDYRAASGTLTFAAGETSKTIAVAVIDDSHDEGEETFALRLSNASGAQIADAEATGTIENTDLMPAALLARFGRATAEQVVTHIEERMAAPRQRGFTARFAGREYQRGQERDFALGFLTQLTQPMGAGMSGAAPMGGAAMGGAAPMGMGSPAAVVGAPGAGMGGMGGGAMGMPCMGGMSGGAMGMPGMGGGAMGMPCEGRATGMGGMGGTAAAMGMGGQHAPMGGGPGMAGHGPMDGAHGGGLVGTMLGYDPLSNSGFELNRESRGGILSVWSRSSRSQFTGLEDALSLNGDVRTTMIGADYSRGALTVGLSVGRTLGLGGYSGPSGGQMTTSMTGFYPWVGYQLSDRVSVWGVTGYGMGSLSLTPNGGGALETGVSMAMSAVGTRSELAGSRATGGFSLALKADALWVGAASDLLDGAAGRLNASEAGVTRVRTALEGSRAFSLGGRLSLTPSVEVGLRRDGGDAETGAGMDVGGGLAFSDTVTGLSLDVRVRTLVVHQAEGFTERGMSLSFGWDPTPSSPLGLTAKLAPSWGGQAQGGAEALWGNQMAYGLGSHQMYGSGDRLDAEVGYGLSMGARFVGTPRVGVSNSEHGRDYRFGYGLAAVDQGSVKFELGIEGQRRERPMRAGADTAFLGMATLGWGGGSGARAGRGAPRMGSLEAPVEPVGP